VHWCVFGAKGASIREIIDPLSVSCYLYKVPQEHAYPCVLTAGEYREIPGPASLAGLVPEAASSKVWPQSPNRSRLAKGRDTSLTRVKERREGDIRIGARAFLHLGGLCEPEPAKRSWLFPRKARKRPTTVSVLVW